MLTVDVPYVPHVLPPGRTKQRWVYAKLLPPTWNLLKLSYRLACMMALPLSLYFPIAAQSLTLVLTKTLKNNFQKTKSIAHGSTWRAFRLTRRQTNFIFSPFIRLIQQEMRWSAGEKQENLEQEKVFLFFSFSYFYSMWSASQW